MTGPPINAIYRRVGMLHVALGLLLLYQGVRFSSYLLHITGLPVNAGTIHFFSNAMTLISLLLPLVVLISLMKLPINRDQKNAGIICGILGGLLLYALLLLYVEPELKPSGTLVSQLSFLIWPLFPVWIISFPVGIIAGLLLIKLRGLKGISLADSMSTGLVVGFASYILSIALILLKDEGQEVGRLAINLIIPLTMIFSADLFTASIFGSFVTVLIIKKLKNS